MRVWMVHRESGRYSDWTYDVRGVFSTYDKACEYINSLGVLVGRMECDDYWENVNIYGMDPSCYDYCDMATPVSTDGVTFRYAVAGSDIPFDEVEPFAYNVSYHITEYELDKVGVANGND